MTSDKGNRNSCMPPLDAGLKREDNKDLYTRGAIMTRAPPIQRQVRLPLHIVDLAADELRSTSGDHVDLRSRSSAC